MTRPTQDEYGMMLAHTTALRATCPRASVGAVLMRDGRLLASGYNGAPRGLQHGTQVGCLIIDNHCQRAVHAEANAIIQAALHGVSTQGSTAYITHFPCLTCAKMLINAGVIRIVYASDYRVSAEACSMLKGAGVQYEQV